MRLIVVGGGTGGHLFPGIAVATAIRERIPTAKVLFIGTSRLLDQQALAGQGFALAALECGGVKGLGFVGRLRSLCQMPGAVLTAVRMLKKFAPDLVFGVGGYVTGPVLLAAKLLRVPIVIHEQNSVPGLANRLAGILAHQVCISLPCAPPFPVHKTILTGNPVRREILAAAELVRQPDAIPTLLVLGGSQGAHRVNLLMMEAVGQLHAQGLAFRLIHQTGAADQEQVAACYAELGIEAEVSAFIRDMAAVYSRADLAVSRAGATTLAELAVMGLPAFLIPYPFAADDHQSSNAAHYVQGGGAQMMRESELNSTLLAQSIKASLQDRQALQGMATKMRTLALPHAAHNIVDLCLQLAPNEADQNAASTRRPKA
jgi:UDP-N-acetylglucosamine--N-acetylmuramyl-(pentapeptide) pyrophosphoryl-undecaprenol N-acetylglucosamine transferase